jgi:glycosyltransferase involved in cell wall biosynthesis
MTPERRIRLTAVMTHPIQYYSPWFRFIAREAKEIELKVLYASEPTPEQQGVGFEAPFTWDIPLRDGYESEVMRSARAGDRFDSDSFLGLDVPDVGARIERTEPDAVLLSGWHSITLVRAIQACRRRRIPLLYRGDTHLNGRRPGVRHLPWRLRTRGLLKRFDRYLSVGRRTREYLRSFGISEGRVFDSPHAVDNDLFSREAAPYQTPGARRDARKEWGIEADDFVAIFVGKLSSHKRPSDLLRAAGLMKARPVIAIAGWGPLATELSDAGAALHIPVVRLGLLEQSALGRAYAISDCLALTSESESWGLVVNEAMATGLPCVVSERVGCAPDLVVPGETGELFPVGDVAALAAALDRLRDERAAGKSRDGDCRRRVREFSFENATRGLIEACRSVVK